VRAKSAFIVGAGVAFLFDPRLGKSRRALLRDRALALARRTRRMSVRKAKYAAGHAQGLAAETRNTVLRHAEQAADETVKSRILSDAFRKVPISTGDVNVDVVNGVATLRGSVPSPSLVDDLVREVRAVPGVRDVRQILNVAGHAAQS
jgi:osmotically-inducible protein OsmY